MKTLYIFKLNKSTYALAKNKPYNIYLLLNTIYNQNKINLIFSYNLFNEICVPINREFFNSYIYDLFKEDYYYTKYKSVHMYNNYLEDEVSKIIVGNTFIKIKSNKDNNIFVMNICEFKDLFVCDFKTDYYELLDKKLFVK